MDGKVLKLYGRLKGLAAAKRTEILFCISLLNGQPIIRRKNRRITNSLSPCNRLLAEKLTVP